MRDINSFRYLFCIYGIFFQYGPTNHIRPHRLLQAFVSDLHKLQFLFFPFFYLFHNLYQNFIILMTYILFWYIMSTLLTKMMNQFLYFLQFSAISFIFRKIEHRVEHQWVILSLSVYSNNCSKINLLGFWEQSLVFQRAFMLLVIINS